MRDPSPSQARSNARKQLAESGDGRWAMGRPTVGTVGLSGGANGIRKRAAAGCMPKGEGRGGRVRGCEGARVRGARARKGDEAGLFVSGVGEEGLWWMCEGFVSRHAARERSRHRDRETEGKRKGKGKGRGATVGRGERKKERKQNQDQAQDQQRASRRRRVSSAGLTFSRARVTVRVRVRAAVLGPKRSWLVACKL